MPQYIMLANFTDQGLKGVKEVPLTTYQGKRDFAATGRAAQHLPAGRLAGRREAMQQ